MGTATNQIIEQDTDNGAIAYVRTSDGVLVLESVRLHLSAAGGAVENFTIYIDSGVAAAYDVVLSATNMNAETDVHYLPARPIPIADNDNLEMTYTNTNGRTWGLEVVYRNTV